MNGEFYIRYELLAATDLLLRFGGPSRVFKSASKVAYS
jgi:hypothetical protein